MPAFERLIPVLVCRDVQAAHDFLVWAFGFDAGGSDRGGNDQRVHGEVRVAGAPIRLHRVMALHELDSPLAPGVAAAGSVVHVADVDAHFERARAAGARIDCEPADQPQGQREYGAGPRGPPLVVRGGDRSAEDGAAQNSSRIFFAFFGLSLAIAISTRS